MDSEVEWNKGHMEKVVGAKLVETYIDGGMLALIFAKGKQRWTVFAQRDTEGNGPGFLSVHHSKNEGKDWTDVR